MTTTDQEQARLQAKAQYDSIALLIDALTAGQEGDSEFFVNNHKDLTSIGIEIEYDEDNEFEYEVTNWYEIVEQVQDIIADDPLSVEFRSEWVAYGDEMEPAEFRILLCTGGPAVQIMGDLDEHGTPYRAYLQYQDWFTPWTDYVGSDIDGSILLAYAQAVIPS